MSNANLPKHLFQSMLLALLATTFLAANALAQKTPKFADYPSAATYKGKTAPLILTGEAKTFRTRLKQAAEGKPNFAGQFIVATWGCGTSCLMGAVIDAKTGKVYMLPHTLCCWMDVEDDFKPIDYQLNSRMIVFNAARDEKENDNGSHYYKFTGGRFTLISSIKKPA